MLGVLWALRSRDTGAAGPRVPSGVRGLGLMETGPSVPCEEVARVHGSWVVLTLKLEHSIFFFGIKLAKFQKCQCPEGRSKYGHICSRFWRTPG